MATDADIARILQQQGLSPEQEDQTDESVQRALAYLGIEPAPEESFLGQAYETVAQPIRTAFGATQGALPAAFLSRTEAYKQAQEELGQTLGVDEQSPWYEKVEAAPGLGDVLAQTISPEVRESTLGRAVGPIARMGGNILGDPTTYTPFVAAKLGKIGAAAEAAGLASKAAPVASGLRGLDLSMAGGAAFAYGPRAAEGAYESFKGIGEAETTGEAVASSVSAVLMTGLTALMAKGAMDATKAVSAWHAHRAATGATGAEVDAIERELVGRLQQEQMQKAMAAREAIRNQPTPDFSGMGIRDLQGAVGEAGPMAAANRPPVPSMVEQPTGFRGEVPQGQGIEALQAEVAAAGAPPLVRPRVEVPQGFRGKVEAPDLRNLQEEVASAPPLEGPQPPPLRQIPPPEAPQAALVQPPEAPIVVDAPQTPTEAPVRALSRPEVAPPVSVEAPPELPPLLLVKDGQGKTAPEAMWGYIERVHGLKPGTITTTRAANNKKYAAARDFWQANYKSASEKAKSVEPTQTTRPTAPAEPTTPAPAPLKPQTEAPAAPIPAQPAVDTAPTRIAQQLDADVTRVSTSQGTERVPSGKFGYFTTVSPDDFEARLRQEGWTETKPGHFTKDGRWVTVRKAGPTTQGKMVEYGIEPPAPTRPVEPTAPSAATPEPTAPAAASPEPTLALGEAPTAPASLEDQLRASIEARGGTPVVPKEAPTTATEPTPAPAAPAPEAPKLDPRLSRVLDVYEERARAAAESAKGEKDAVEAANRLMAIQRLRDNPEELLAAIKANPGVRWGDVVKQHIATEKKKVAAEFTGGERGEDSTLLAGARDLERTPDAGGGERATGVKVATPEDIILAKEKAGADAAEVSEVTTTAGEVAAQKGQEAVVPRAEREDRFTILKDALSTRGKNVADFIDELGDFTIDIPGRGPQPFSQYKDSFGQYLVERLQGKTKAQAVEAVVKAKLASDGKSFLDNVVNPAERVLVGKAGAEDYRPAMADNVKLRFNQVNTKLAEAVKLKATTTPDEAIAQVIALGEMKGVFIDRPRTAIKAFVKEVLKPEPGSPLYDVIKRWDRISDPEVAKLLFNNLDAAGQARVRALVNKVKAEILAEAGVTAPTKLNAIPEKWDEADVQILKEGDKTDIFIGTVKDRDKFIEKLKAVVAGDDKKTIRQVTFGPDAKRSDALAVAKALGWKVEEKLDGSVTKVRRVDTLPAGKDVVKDSGLSVREQEARYFQYEKDYDEAVDLDGFRVVNHDGVADPNYVLTNQVVGEGIARAQQKILDDLVEAVNRIDPNNKLDVTFGGLTTSPHLAGLYTEGDKARIFTNFVEAVHATGDYEGALDRMLHQIVHEVTHNKGIGHGDQFSSYGEYLRAHLEAWKKLPEYKKMLREAMPETLFNKIKDELVPTFRQMRDEVNGRTATEGLPARRAAGSTEAVPNRAGRGAEGTQADLAARVQPRGTVPGGTAGQAGQLRSAAEAGPATAKRPTQGEATGRGTGRSPEETLSDEEAARIVEAANRPGEGWIEDPTPEQVAEMWDGTPLKRVEELLAEDPVLTEEKAKKLLDELVTRNVNRGAMHVKGAFQTAWSVAGHMVEQMSPKEIAERAKSLPAPRKDDQMAGVINLLHNSDISDEMKARVQWFGENTKGMWAKDTVEKWADVDDEVKELLDIATPEQWSEVFRTKGGGLRSKDALLLRYVHNELLGKIEDIEGRLAEAAAAGDTKMWEDLSKQKGFAVQNYISAANTLERGMTGVARALGIGRAALKRLDPQASMYADLFSSIRERVRTKFKDPVEAENKAREFFEAMKTIMQDPNGGDYKEIWKLWRTMMGSKMYPDKVLEFYKAGLLGWPSRVANLSSNTLFRTVRYVEDAVAGALDWTKSGLTGSKREAYAGEVSVSALALGRAFKEAFPEWSREMGRNFRLQPDDLQKALAQGALMEDMLHMGGAIGGKMGEFIRFQFKGMAADDALAKHMSRMDTMYREVYRKLRRGDFKPKAGESYAAATERIVGDFRTNYDKALKGQQYDPTMFKEFEPIAKRAEEIAKRDTFQADLGNLGRGVQSVLRENPFLQVFFPFLRTPWNITKETVTRTPLGFITTAKRWKNLSEAERMSELAKPLTGTLLGAGMLAVGLQGNITGGGPVDPDEKAMQESTGWRPYSVRIGDQYMEYKRLEPIAAVVGVAADAAEGIRNGDFSNWKTGAQKVLQSAAENVTNKTFFQTATGLSAVISHPTQYLGQFLKQMQGSLIPNSLGPVPVASLARAYDPFYRQAEPLSMDVFYSKLPYLSTLVQPQYGPSGTERLRSSGPMGHAGAAWRLISPFQLADKTSGPASDGAEEVVRIDSAPKAPSKYWNAPGGLRVPLAADERALIAKQMQKATEVIGRQVMKNPSYLRLPDDENDPNYRFGMKTKQIVIRNLYSRYREEAMKKIRPALIARARRQAQA